MHRHLMHTHESAMVASMARMDDERLATWRAFLTAHARITRAISADLAAADLPYTLYRSPGRSLRVNELAGAVALSPTGMSRFVDRVERAGCVRRAPDPDDRRALRVVLTDDGRALLRRMWPVYAAGIERHFAAHLG